MPVEHQHESHEHHEQSTAELEQLRQEQLDRLRHNPEVSGENAETRAEIARQEIERHHEKRQPKAEAPAPESTPSKPFLPFLSPKLNYQQTMTSLQRSLKPMSRKFSKFIHQPAVEKTSEIMERTIARPSVTLGATWTALIVGSIFYLVARHYGYALSGSELLFSFLVGAILGLGIETLLRLFRRRSRT